MSERWVYCPLCEGYDVTENGTKTACPACQGAGQVKEGRMRQIRSDMALLEKTGGVAEWVHRRLANASTGYSRQREATNTAAAIAARKRSEQQLESTRHTVVMSEAL